MITLFLSLNAFSKSNPVDCAEQLALKYHGTQLYKTSPDPLPYSYHLKAVIDVLAEFGFGDLSVPYNVILNKAAWCHDTVEDTKLKENLAELIRVIGPEAADIVMRVSDGPGTTRAERKAIAYTKIHGDRGATIVKLADRIANVREAIRTHNTKKLETYRGEQGHFREAVFVPAVADAMWEHLESLFKQNPAA